MKEQNLKMKDKEVTKNTVKIRTWNVDWFRNQKRSGQKWEYDENDCNINAYNKIVKDIKDFLDSSQKAIVFMQEVPYYSNDTWEEHLFYSKLKTDFSNGEYDIEFNITSQKQIMMTIAITKKGRFKENKSCSIGNNRIVSLCIDDLTLIGVHMPTNFAKGSEKDLIWSNLIDYASKKEANKEKIVIAGDFNAYIGCDNKITEKRLIDLCRVAKDIVSDDTPTFIGRTPIDHIFLNFDSKQDYEVLIEKNWSCSDHKFVQVKLNY